MQPEQSQPASSGQPIFPPPNRPKNSLLVPIAILIAGVLIAGAIFFSHNSSQTNAAQISGTQSQSQGSIENVPPLSSTDHILGDPSSPITLVEYSDLECPFCKEFQTTMHQIMDTYGKADEVSWVFRDFPLYQTIHPKAEKEAEASECANQLGGNTAFWSFVDGIYAITPSNNGLDPAELPKEASAIGLNVNDFNTCLSSGTYTKFVEQSYTNAINDGAQGTPYVVLLLQNPISSDTQQAIITNMTTAIDQSQPGAQLPDGFVTFSADGKKVAWNGAIPLAAVQAVLDTILGKYSSN